MLVGKGNALDFQTTGSVDKSKISQGGTILVSQVLLLLEGVISQETESADNTNPNKLYRIVETIYAALSQKSKFSHCKIR